VRHAIALLCLLGMGWVQCASIEPQPIAEQPALCPASTSPLAVRVYSKETFWYHAANAVARRELANLAAARGWQLVEVGPENITDAELAEADVVAFVLSSGDALSVEQRTAFEHYVQRGGGVVGVHSAAFTEPNWEAFGTILGARFRTHPPIRTGVVRVKNAENPLTSGLPSAWHRTDEWYSFFGEPQAVEGLQVLLELEESEDYPADARMGVHPIAWTKSYGAGRVFYTAMGHTEESYVEPLFVQHLARGIEWAGTLRHIRRDCMKR
jgi:uncharacterized protein